MNKWVVFLLMALAFLAGALSFRSGDASPPLAVASATPRDRPSPAVSASTTPGAVSTPHVRATREPSFGLPPRRGDKKSGPKSAPAGASVSAYIFSNALDGPSQTAFPAKAGNIFMTVTPIGLPRGVELEASYRSSLKEDSPFSEPFQSSGPARKRSFCLTPPEGGWSSGPYQVVVKPVKGDQVLTVARFEITEKDAPPAAKHPTPEYMDLVSSPNDQEARSVFDQTDSQIGLLVNTAEVPESVMVRTVWSAVEVEQLAPGEIISVSEKSAPGKDRDAYFTFNPSKSGFLPGSYRVDIYYDQQEMGSQAFFIQPTPQESASSSPTP